MTVWYNLALTEELISHFSFVEKSTKKKGKLLNYVDLDSHVMLHFNTDCLF